MKDIITHSFNEHNKVIKELLIRSYQDILKTSLIMSTVLKSGNTIFWCGNGGSASDSQHIAAELVGRFRNDRKPLKSIALTTDSSVLTCIANDYSYDDIFSRQLDGLAVQGDLLVSISTSGNSESVNRAIKMAKIKGVTTISLLGKSGGKALSLSDTFILVPSETTARIQEAHIMIGHILCQLIEDQLGLS